MRKKMDKVVLSGHNDCPMSWFSRIPEVRMARRRVLVAASAAITLFSDKVVLSGHNDCPTAVG